MGCQAPAKPVWHRPERSGDRTLGFEVSPAYKKIPQESGGNQEAGDGVPGSSEACLAPTGAERRPNPWVRGLPRLQKNPSGIS